ncbi:hypothetical protein [Flavobacterium sp.]|uniref:hypothetical protein n=1 Tax=Flavobacterium sp. TaxID=239 RepID=UPI0037504787
MKHTTKTLIFKSLNLLPNKIGYSLYHKMQHFFDRSSIESKVKKSEITINKIIEICNELKIESANKIIFEFGSGWLPIMPYFFILKCKVKKVFTYDINQHYEKKVIIKFNSIFSKMYDFNIDIDANSDYNLPKSVEYFPLKNIINEDFSKADIVFSRYVLSHVEENDLINMHKKFKSNLKKGSYIIHFISPSDLRQHGDKSISMYDFLKYSKEEWSSIMTKFDYHNRWRLPQYIDLFKSLDFEIVYNSYESVEQGSLNQKLFRELNLHEDFKKYNEEELTAGNIIFVLKV